MSNPSFNGLNITTTGSTLVYSGSTVLKNVHINTKGTVASTVKIYDGVSASGKLLATIDSLSFLGTFNYNINVATGIFIVTTGAPDVTVEHLS